MGDQGRQSVYLAGRAAPDLKRHNQSLVLELIRSRGPVSRAEVARAGGLSLPAVMELVNGLISFGLVRETGTGPSTGGRPPVLLQLVPEAYYVVGVEVGTRTLTAVVTDLSASVKLRLKEPSRMREGPEALSKQVKGSIGQAFERLPGCREKTSGIGLALPGPIMTSEGEKFSPPSFPGWGQLPLGEIIAAEYGMPVFVDNDANAAAIGEHLFGAGRGVNNMVYIVAHRGVGGAAIIDGRLYRGADGGAGEIGHTLIDLEGPECGCGRYGCLEAFVGRAAIARRARRAVKLAGAGELAGREVDEVDAEHVVEAALGGDETAKEVLEETGKYLGIGVSNLMNILNPETVVVGGPTMRGGELLMRPMEKVVRRRVLNGAAERTRLTPGELHEEAGAIGAAALVVREVFTASPPQAGSDNGERGGSRPKENEVSA